MIPVEPTRTNALTEFDETPDNPSAEARGASVKRCPNCATPLHGEWCFECGQRQKSIDRFLLSMVSEAFDDVFSWDSRALRTIAALLFKPGFLAREYLAGRRARYVSPLRLYLIASVSFFFVISAESWLGFKHPLIQLYSADVAKSDHNKAIAPSKQWREEVSQAWDQVSFSWLSAETNRDIRARLRAQSMKAADLAQHDPHALLNAVLNVAPPILFTLVPIFAVFLKLAYVGSGRYYAEHLVLAVHNHSFLFVAFIASGIFSNIGILVPPVQHIGHAALNIWIPLYMYLSLLTTYGQSWLITLVKFAFLSLLYSTLFGVSIAIAVVMGVMTL